jgi:hypothetical protein
MASHEYRTQDPSLTLGMTTRLLLPTTATLEMTTLTLAMTAIL